MSLSILVKVIDATTLSVVQLTTDLQKDLRDGWRFKFVVGTRIVLVKET